MAKSAPTLTVQASPDSTLQKPLVLIGGAPYEANDIVRAVQAAAGVRKGVTYSEDVASFTAPESEPDAKKSSAAATTNDKAGLQTPA